MPDRSRHSARKILGAGPPARADPDGDRRRQDLHRLHVELSAAGPCRRSASCSWSTAPTSAQTATNSTLIARPAPVAVPRALQRAAAWRCRTRQRCAVVITTIQRVYSVLRGEELAEEDEEASALRADDERGAAARRLQPRIPIETFDSDRHRRVPPLDLRPVAAGARVLRRASSIGLTATPSGTRSASSAEPRRRVPLRAVGGRRRQRRLRRLPHQTEISEQGGDGRGRLRTSRCATGAPAPSATKQLDEDLDYTRERARPRGRWCRTRSAPCSRPIATACSPSSSPAAARCRRR